MELYFWVDLFDEMFGKFLVAHPECLVRTKNGARYPGLRDYANATAVREKLDEGIADSLVFGDYERLWDCPDIWKTKPEPPAKGAAPIDFYAPEYVRYARGRVKLYLFSGWLGGNASAEMARCAQYANRHGLDGFFAHESATIERVKGAFDGLRKARDVMK